MDIFLLVASGTGGLWYADVWYVLPLIVSTSLVWAATRHERMAPMLGHAVRIGLEILILLVVIFVPLLLLSWSL